MSRLTYEVQWEENGERKHKTFDRLEDAQLLALSLERASIFQPDTMTENIYSDGCERGKRHGQ